LTDGHTAFDRRIMAAALALAARGRGLTTPNPNVGCLLVKDNRVIGRGWTQKGGRPHAEAMALSEAGEAAQGATAYVTLEPCAHDSERGPACADSLIAARVARVCIGMTDPDPRTNGQGIARLRAAGIDVHSGLMTPECAATMAGFLSRTAKGRPHVTLKLATSLDGMIATAGGQSRWITGEAARAHGHLERARCDMIIVGRATVDADAPKLDVRIPGLEDRAPRRAVLSTKPAQHGWESLTAPEAISDLRGVDHILVEGGASAAAAFLKANLVDRLLLYRAPILIGGGKSCLGDTGLTDLDAAHGRWRLVDTRMLGKDRLEDYEAQ
jgi:diaminohydroxyphosphoribosylaminopyrimidine deaminase / 5-amino-6-(5-phosphoribosylamino)uracil reductase